MFTIGRSGLAINPIIALVYYTSFRRARSGVGSCAEQTVENDPPGTKLWELLPSVSLFLASRVSTEERVANQNKERKPCEQATTEQDPKKLLPLMSEINAILDDQTNGHADERKSLKSIEAEARERIASSNECIRQGRQLIEETRRIVRKHRK